MCKYPVPFLSAPKKCQRRIRPSFSTCLQLDAFSSQLVWALLLLSNGPFVVLHRVVHVIPSVQMLFPKQTEGVTKSLAARDDFVLFLFTLMTNKKTFLQTATLIEDILGVKKVRVVLVFIRQHEHLNTVHSPDLHSLYLPRDSLVNNGASDLLSNFSSSCV